MTRADPYDSFKWRNVQGSLVTIVTSWGRKPTWIRDDDWIKFAWNVPFQRVNVYSAEDWKKNPAFILRRRLIMVVLPTRYVVGLDGKPDLSTAQIIEDY